MTEFCNCGTCEQAIERGTEFVLKQLVDGDCPGFILAVLDAGFAVLGSAAAMNDKGEHDLIGLLESNLWIEAARRQVAPVIQAQGKELNKRVFEAIQTFHRKQDEEAKLPKDT